MTKKGFCLYACFLLQAFKLTAQTDAYTGAWEMRNSPAAAAPITLLLQIFPAEKSFIYPAQLKITSSNFEAGYEFLLVKKSMWHLAISKNKKAINEAPFKLDNLLTVLNGGFEYSKDQKGQASLTKIDVIGSKAGPVAPPDTSLNKEQQQLYKAIAQLVTNDVMRLIKLDGPPPVNNVRTNSGELGSERIYFGLKDTILLPTRDGVFSISGFKPVNRKSYADSVSIMQNGQMIVEQLALDKKAHGDEILLDTGLNFITLFADNFANGLPNNGRLDLQFGELKYKLDFRDQADSGATFIVGRFYCSRERFKERSFQVYTPPAERPLLKNERLIDRIVATSQQLQLAIWDDATEDGDSISIMVEGKWLVRGFPVKKNPQFLTVTLKPGPNTFVFVADNLGSIPPNTSVLEIIDGKKRKSYTMETILGEKNLVEIFYDVKPGG